VIFCLSQLHTGTWTTIAWLARHDQVKGLMLSTDVVDVLAGKPTIDQLQESGSYHQKFHQSMVYHEHVRPDHWSDDQMCRTQLVMAMTNPTVIPIRDPLSSLISYQNRASLQGREGTEGFLPMEHVIDRWVMMAKVFDILRENVEFICWDLINGDPDELCRIALALGITEGQYLGAIINNSMGDYPLKKAYQDGDRESLSQQVDGFQCLVDREELLRPFLERLGYSDLVWWS